MGEELANSDVRVVLNIKEGTFYDYLFINLLI